MKIYTDALERIYSKLVRSNNYIAISMYISIVLGLIGVAFWVTDMFFLQNSFITVGSITFAVGYWLSLVSVLIGYTIHSYWGMEWNDAVDEYEEARAKLFKRNIAVANAFYEEHKVS